MGWIYLGPGLFYEEMQREMKGVAKHTIIFLECRLLEHTTTNNTKYLTVLYFRSLTDAGITRPRSRCHKATFLFGGSRASNSVLIQPIERI